MRVNLSEMKITRNSAEEIEIIYSYMDQIEVVLKPDSNQEQLRLKMLKTSKTTKT